ncbi:hypothetical protein [Streptomyces sp. 8L]|uniref:hypothetical protein n=1 Tax=Streptomyces sp. 8L TaxID=2877242 RepID=UPI001CD338B7|nr:hypothetical protein [Streptomyces sp. 8L]MCA1217994.1 hypothetical protein [Streptomyces sp. 8L]
MRDDETGSPAGTAAAEEFRRAAGPRHAARHAAPRKSLLTKFHVPAGKAMMLAAMPTAVFVGMGLTPRLALADEGSGNAGTNPCVSRSDEAGASESPSPSASTSAKPDPSASSGAAGGKSDGGTKTGGGSADPTPSKTPSPTSSASQTPDPSQSSAPAGSGGGGDSGSGGGLLGGLGSVVGGLLGGGSSSSSSPSPSDTPSPSATTGSGSTSKSGSTASDSPSKGASVGSLLGGSSSDTSKDDGAKSGGSGAKSKDGATSKDGSKDVKGKVGGLSKAKAGTAQTKTDAIKALLAKKGIPFSDIQTSSKQSETKADGGSCDDGPCDNLLPILKPPTEDADAPPMANDPWHLTSSNLGLNGLCYRGLVDIKTQAGTKRVMKFTADSIDITDLHQTVDNKDAHGNVVTHTQIETAPGSKSTIDGPVTMYTEKLSGNMFGLLPITFSPDFPPPIQIDKVFFTNAKVDQAGQFGGTLSMKGLHNTIG